MKSKKRRRPTPLAPPPNLSQSRKQARITTTLFHRLTRERDAAAQRGESTAEIDAQLADMGGRREYQRASQISVSFHSTSKWVLGCLARNGWLYGIPVIEEDGGGGDNDDNHLQKHQPQQQQRRSKQTQKRPCRLLEVGAINTELLDAAASSEQQHEKKNCKLSVRAIDLHSMHEGIEEADFLKLSAAGTKQYDVIVCSMVLNCVTTAADRGEMLARLFHFLRPGGLVFLTLPKTCLNLSPYMDRARLEDILEAVGLQVEQHEKDSPKVAFFVCRRPESARQPPTTVDAKWNTASVIRRGKKYRNEFAVTLCKNNVSGSNLIFDDEH